MRVIETKIYTIEEHPNKEKCFNWIRNNWFDLNQHTIDEVIKSIEVLSKLIGGTVNYSIGQESSRCQHITFKDYDKELLKSINEDSYHLTGFCYDYDLIKGLKENNLNHLLSSIYADTEYIYSNDGLSDLCYSNEYEFNEQGEII